MKNKVIKFIVRWTGSLLPFFILYYIVEINVKFLSLDWFLVAAAIAIPACAYSIIGLMELVEYIKKDMEMTNKSNYDTIN